MNKYRLEIMNVEKSTDFRHDMQLLLINKEEGQASKKFAKVPIAILVEEDGSITLLKEPGTYVEVRDFGYPTD